MKTQLLRIRSNPLGLALLVALSSCYLYLFVYFPTINNPNENVRVYMTNAMVEDASMAIGRRDYPGKARPGKALPGAQPKRMDHSGPVERWGYVNDKALVCDSPEAPPPASAGLLYSAKAPGTSFWGVPAYMAIRAVKGDDVSKDTTVFWLRILCVVLPTLVFLWSVYAFLGRYAPSRAIRNIVVLGLGLGSMSFTYGQMFAGHQLTAIALFSAFMCMVIGREKNQGTTWPWSAAAGLFLSLSVAFEYPTIFAAITLLAFWAWTRPSWKDVLAFGAGGLPGVIVVTSFHQIAFGAIHRTPYTTLENPGFVRDIAPGFMGLQGPTLEAFWGSFFVPFNGMFFFSPWMAFVILAAGWWMVRRIRFEDQAPPRRGEIGIALLVAAVFTLFISSHSLWRGGWTLGPRYIVGFVPFAALAIAACAQDLTRRFPAATLVGLSAAVGASIFVTFTCSMVSQGFPFEYYNPFVEAALPLLRDEYVPTNLGNFFGLKGMASVLPLLLLVIGLILVSALQAEDKPPWSLRMARSATSLLLTTLLVIALTLPSTPWNAGKASKDRWLRKVWQPIDQTGEQREFQELEDLRKSGKSLDSSAWQRLGNLRALNGKDRAALQAYRKSQALSEAERQP